MSTPAQKINAAKIVPFPLATEPYLSKKQIAAHYGRSIKWVEAQMRAGLPYRKDTPTAWPMYRLSEVDAWLYARDD